MRTRSACILLGIIVIAAGSFIRLWRLNDRPMHTDEAVHAHKFAALLEQGDYTYDPHEYHGPTLNYATLLSAFLRGETTYSQIDAATLRWVPAVFGIGLVLTPLLFGKSLTGRTAGLSLLLLAFSPAFVYYSRYYIQETLLVCFTAVFLGCAWRYGQTRRLGWMLAAGIALGLMHATKETFVFSLLAAGLAALVCRADRAFRFKPLHWLGGLAAAVLVSVLLFSSFGTHWQGVPDSLATYGTWFNRAAGQSPHIHPWSFYLDRLTWNELTEPITWNEDGIVVLAAFGLIFAFTRRDRFANSPALIRFIAVYTLLLTVIYSVIPYKTPWCLLNFLYGMAILAAFAADRLIRQADTRWQKSGIWLLVVVFLVAAPVAQSWLLNGRYAASPDNPYVYAHTTNDIEPMVAAVNRAAAVSPQGDQIPIQVIAPDKDYWPLPWYLRRYPNVGYWSQVDPSAASVPLILANAAVEQTLLNTLYTVPEPGRRHLYSPLYDRAMYLRPHVEWRGYIRKDLADRMNQPQPATAEPPAQPRDSWMNKPDKAHFENLLKFTHEAMHTVFEVYIQDDRGSYAGRAARTAFNEVDRLERLLSRFIDNSDISRINHAAPGQSVIVDEDTLRCLLIAERARRLTGGAFDVTIGQTIEGWKNSDAPPTDGAAANRLIISEEAFTVTIPDGGLDIDLGGIGKGYAVDAMAAVLDEWGIKRALIHGGASSVRALDAPQNTDGWPVTLTNPVNDRRLAKLNLSHDVIAGSGLQQGSHIVDPSTGTPVTGRAAAWVRCRQSAALADALSTAAMIMPVEKLRRLAADNPDMAILLVVPDGDQTDSLKIGTWPDE